MNPLVRLAPRAVIRWVARARPDPTPEEIVEWTGLGEGSWNEMAGLFPGLGPRPGPDAARHRRSFGLLGENALSRGSSRVRWLPERPPPDPTLYLTLHLGDIRLLRYLLRLAGIPAATIVDETQLGNPKVLAENRRIDRRRPHALPHSVFSGEPHRLRSALRHGSLLAAVDRIHPPAPGKGTADRTFPFLGGLLTVDLSVLRLARLAGVPARPLFVTIPGERLTVTVGEPLPRDREAAGACFGDLADAVARDCPAAFDGYTHRFLLRRPVPEG
jgi:hypothetical protein